MNKLPLHPPPHYAGSRPCSDSRSDTSRQVSNAIINVSHASSSRPNASPSPFPPHSIPIRRLFIVVHGLRCSTATLSGPRRARCSILRRAGRAAGRTAERRDLCHGRLAPQRPTPSTARRSRHSRCEPSPTLPLRRHPAEDVRIARRAPTVEQREREGRCATRGSSDGRQ